MIYGACVQNTRASILFRFAPAPGKTTLGQATTPKHALSFYMHWEQNTRGIICPLHICTHTRVAQRPIDRKTKIQSCARVRQMPIRSERRVAIPIHTLFVWARPREVIASRSNVAPQLGVAERFAECAKHNEVRASIESDRIDLSHNILVCRLFACAFRLAHN